MYLVLILVSLSVVNSQHAGAYSSPQYAKLLYPRAAQRRQFTEEHVRDNPSNRTAIQNREEIPGGIFDNAKWFLANTGGQLLSEVARSFLARADGGTSQVGFECVTKVLSLNLTNLVILVVLKALILTAGFFGAGAWRGHSYGRSIDHTEKHNNRDVISQDELQLLLGYLISTKTKDYGCLELISCKKPGQALLYTAAAEMLMKTVRMIGGENTSMSTYKTAIQHIRGAAQWGSSITDNIYNKCEYKYQCRDPNQIL